MKKFLMILLSVFMVSSLFAGGKSEPVEAEATGPVEIEFWTTQTQSDRQATIQVLIDTFEVLNPGITVKLVPVDENDLSTQLNTAAAAKNMPAMIESASENAVAFGSEGMLDISAATAVVDQIGADNYYAGTLKLVATSDGSGYYSVPYHGWVQGIWYRADWFEEAGLEAPTNWDSIAKAAEYFYQPDDNQYGILVGTTAEAFTEQCFTEIAMSNGAGLYDKDGNLVFNSPEMKEVIEFYTELAQYNPPGPQTCRARDYYIQGKMAMFFYSTYIMDDLAIAENAAGSLTNENFADLAGASFDPELVTNTRLASTITNTQSAGYGTVVNFSFPNQEDPAVTAAAQKFVQYLYAPNSYITWLHMAPGGMNPVIKDIAVNHKFQEDPKGIFKNYGTEKMAEIISGLDSIETFSIVEGNRIPAASQVYSKQIIPQMIYKITQEGMDIQAAMDWAESEMEKL